MLRNQIFQTEAILWYLWLSGKKTVAACRRPYQFLGIKNDMIPGLNLGLNWTKIASEAKKSSRNLVDKIKSSNFVPLSKTTKERCRSGRSGRSRKPLYACRTGGSNPSLSAVKACNWFSYRLLSFYTITFTPASIDRVPTNPESFCCSAVFLSLNQRSRVTRAVLLSYCPTVLLSSYRLKATEA